MSHRNRCWRLVAVLVLLLVFALPVQAQDQKAAYSLDLFKETFQYILDNYVDDIDPRDLEEMAIKGMLQQLDMYTQYMNGEEYSEFLLETDGQFGGVGMRIEKMGDYITVVAPLPGTPAEKAGIKAGDKIIKVDGKDVVGMNVQPVAALIRGEPGTVVTITVKRDDTAEPMLFVLTREIIQMEVVVSEMLEGSIGYIKLTGFSTLSASKYNAALAELRAKGAKGIILDLRNNPGGYLGSALSVASSFVGEGDNLLHIESRADGDNTYYSTSKALGMPLVVLINEGSASGSEIVAGVVQDHGVGTLVGVTTFGKASVQHLHELPNSGAIKVTTAQYLTPNKRLISGVGIVPDVLEEDPDKQLPKAVEIILEKIKASGGGVDLLKLTIGKNEVWADGAVKTIGAAPYLNAGTTMAPLRSIAELMGYKVDYKAADSKITLNKGSKELVMWIGKTRVTENGKEGQLSAAPVVKDGVTFVPLRFIAEFFGAKVSWSNGQVSISLD